MNSDKYNWLRNQFNESSKPCNHGNNDYGATIIQLVRCRKTYHQFVELYFECLECEKGMKDAFTPMEWIHTFEILNNEKWDKNGCYYGCYKNDGLKNDRYVSYLIYPFFKIGFCSRLVLVNFHLEIIFYWQSKGLIEMCVVKSSLCTNFWNRLFLLSRKISTIEWLVLVPYLLFANFFVLQVT